MSRRLYSDLSSTLRGVRESHTPESSPDREGGFILGWSACCYAIRNMLAQQSDGFEAERFLIDCGVQTQRRVGVSREDGALLVEHAHLCGRELTVQRLREVNARHISEVSDKDLPRWRDQAKADIAVRKQTIADAEKLSGLRPYQQDAVRMSAGFATFEGDRRLDGMPPGFCAEFIAAYMPPPADERTQDQKETDEAAEEGFLP